MQKSTLVISLLAFALLVSNAWWAYETVDASISHSYLKDSLEETQQALSQSLAIIKVSGTSHVTRHQIVEAAQKAWTAGEPFEKDGYLRVGRIGLRFDNQGHLLEAIQ